MVLAVVGGFDYRAGATAGLAAALVLLVDDRRAGTAWDAMLLDISSAAYMAVLTVLSWFVPNLALLHYGTALPLGWLAVAAWLGLAIGRPFTVGIARRSVSEFVAGTARFRRVNVTITAAWAVCFTLDAATLTALQHWFPSNAAALLVCKFGFFAAAAIFTARYPALVQRSAEVDMQNVPAE
ncbi:hypothetical protein AWN90_11950 [Nocardia terpenica]|uniref:DUF3159 domain-containing protein n=1 Tax=Nocardia terpenica TaxID=455432 RepID=A0A164HJ89_9NOCA|nr:hypothetical protein AWN90_11950 [Nocardia terpenica]NQE88470.1 hypothetical protein [Nocardia terpenica]